MIGQLCEMWFPAGLRINCKNKVLKHMAQKSTFLSKKFPPNTDSSPGQEVVCDHDYTVLQKDDHVLASYRKGRTGVAVIQQWVKLSTNTIRAIVLPICMYIMYIKMLTIQLVWSKNMHAEKQISTSPCCWPSVSKTVFLSLLHISQPFKINNRISIWPAHHSKLTLCHGPRLSFTESALSDMLASVHVSQLFLLQEHEFKTHFTL